MNDNSGSFVFDDSEFAPAYDYEATVDDVVSDLEEEAAPVPTDSFYTDIERRFEVANYYKALLNDTLFSENTEAAQIVETAVRGFIREQFEVLFNMKEARPAVAELPFTEEEIDVLKSVASKLIKNARLIPSDRPKPVPTVRKTEVPPPMVKKAVVQQPAPRPVAPAAAPAVRKRAPVPGSTKAPAPAPRPRGRPPKAKSQAPESAVAKANVAEDTGEIVERDGQKFRVMRNSLGDTYEQNITPKVVSSNRIPMPSGDALGMIMQQQAAAQIDSTTNTMAIHAAAGALAGLTGGE